MATTQELFAELSEEYLARPSVSTAHVFTSGGRKMREWVAVTATGTWESMMAESFAFVEGLSA